MQFSGLPLGSFPPNPFPKFSYYHYLGRVVYLSLVHSAGEFHTLLVSEESPKVFPPYHYKEEMTTPPIIQVEWKSVVTKQYYWDGAEKVPIILEVSNTGLVRRKCRTDDSKYIYYSQHAHKNAYWRIKIVSHGLSYYYKVHHLVWRAFKGTYDNETLCIDHINGISLDNRLSNLQLLTYEENSKKQGQDWSGKLTAELEERFDAFNYA